MGREPVFAVHEPVFAAHESVFAVCEQLFSPSAETFFSCDDKNYQQNSACFIFSLAFFCRERLNIMFFFMPNKRYFLFYPHNINTFKFTCDIDTFITTFLYKMLKFFFCTLFIIFNFIRMPIFWEWKKHA